MSLIPVTLLTGFLGSGKTTLLNRLLRDPALKNALVLINEFGEIGLDHHLIEKIEESDGQQRILMASGCLCCTIQSDLSKTLRQMAIDRVRGTVTEFERVIIETTGLADPAPILHTLMQDPLVAAHYRLDGVVTTVDAVVGDATLTAQPEAVKQAAVADRIILTKQDIADPATVDALRARLHKLNPAAPILSTDAPAPALIEAGLWNPDTKSLDVRRWLHADAYEAHGHHHHDHDHGHHHHHHNLNRHDDRIEAHCLTVNAPLPWDAVTLWLQSLTAYRGEDILRLKAILNLRGQETPTVLHGVQHLLHPPVKLPAWPDADHRSRIVLITRDISRDLLEKSLKQLTEVVG
jgi:G3E family GTPase